MDIARPDQTRRKRIRRILYGGAAVLAVGGITLGLSKLKPAAPGVERGTVWIDTVKRGPMVRDVRGQGTLVPEDIRWIPATTQGRVERIRIRPGSTVGASSIILDLSNPQLEQELHDTELKLNGADATLANLKVQSRNEALAQEAATANIEAEYKKAVLQVEANEQLSKKGIVSDMILKQSRLDADQLSARYEIAKKQLASYERVDSGAGRRPAVRGRAGARGGAAETAAGRRPACPRRFRGRAAGRARRRRPAGRARRQPRARRRSVAAQGRTQNS